MVRPRALPARARVERTTFLRRHRRKGATGAVEGGGGPSALGHGRVQALRSRLVTRSLGSRKRRCGPAPGASAGGRACLSRRPSDEAHPRVREAGKGWEGGGKQRISLARARSRTCSRRPLRAEVRGGRAGMLRRLAWIGCGRSAGRRKGCTVRGPGCPLGPASLRSAATNA